MIHTSVLAIVPKPLVSVQTSVTIHSALEEHLVFIVEKKKKTLQNVFIFFMVLEFSCHYQKPNKYFAPPKHVVAMMYTYENLEFNVN